MEDIMEDRLNRLNSAFASFEAEAGKIQEEFYEQRDAAYLVGLEAEAHLCAVQDTAIRAIYAASVRGELPKGEIAYLVSDVQKRTQEKIGAEQASFAAKEAELKKARIEQIKLVTKQLYDFLDQLYEEI